MRHAHATVPLEAMRREPVERNLGIPPAKSPPKPMAGPVPAGATAKDELLPPDGGSAGETFSLPWAVGSTIAHGG